jgi:putative nucleotidyltransferase with HDIG domain
MSYNTSKFIRSTHLKSSVSALSDLEAYPAHPAGIGNGSEPYTTKVFRLVSISPPHSLGDGASYRTHILLNKLKLTLAISELATIHGIEPGTACQISGISRHGKIVPFLRVLSATALSQQDPVPWLELVAPSHIICPDDYYEIAHIVQTLSAPYQALIHTLFGEEAIAKQYFNSPASISGHHAQAGGLARHTCEVLGIANDIFKHYRAADQDTLIVACLLHDLGKIGEYQVDRLGRFQLSDRGRLIGHRTTGIELLARALQTAPLPEEQHLSLMHCLAAAHAPDHVGLRAPTTPEAELLSMADRLSAKADLVNRITPANSAWGRHHPHLPARPYLVAHANKRHENRS